MRVYKRTCSANMVRTVSLIMINLRISMTYETAPFYQLSYCSILFKEEIIPLLRDNIPVNIFYKIYVSLLKEAYLLRIPLYISPFISLPLILCIATRGI